MNSNSWNKNILFVDNENKNWIGDMDKFNKTIGYIEIDSESPNQLLVSSGKGLELQEGAKKNRVLNEEYLRLFTESNNTYAAYINNLNNIDAKTTLTSYFNKAYPNNGMDAIMPQLSDWIVTHSSGGLNANSSLLFDWDRTVTAVEGMLFGKNNELLQGLDSGTITFDDLLMFVMSSSERIEAIRNMFENIITGGISFYIITNNSNASISAPSRRVYIELLKRLTGLPEEQLEPILYSSADNGGIYKKQISACKTPIESIREICQSILSKIATNANTASKITTNADTDENPAKRLKTAAGGTRGGKKTRRKHRKTRNTRKNKRHTKRRR
jgi:hypothetical protein